MAPRRKPDGKNSLARLQNQLQQVKISLHGRCYTPPVDPPTLTMLPWNNFVLSYSATIQGTTITLTNGDVRKALAKRLGLADTTSLEFKVRAVSGWLLGQRYRQLSMQTYTANSTTVLASIVDQSTNANAPKVGYHYSTAVSEYPHTLGDDSYTFVTLTASNETASTNTGNLTLSARYTLHIHLVWRYNGDGAAGWVMVN